MRGDLRSLGVEPGQPVRFRERAGGRWRHGRATGIERDASIGVVDARGGSRAIPADRLEVRTVGRRGAPRWEALADVAARTEQLGLFGGPGGQRPAVTTASAARAPRPAAESRWQ